MCMWKTEATVRGPAATDSDILNSHRRDRGRAVLGLNPSHLFYQVSLHPPQAKGGCYYLNSSFVGFYKASGQYVDTARAMSD